jgi:hypothetical protein
LKWISRRRQQQQQAAPLTRKQNHTRSGFFREHRFSSFHFLEQALELSLLFAVHPLNGEHDSFGVFLHSFDRPPFFGTNGWFLGDNPKMKQ